jgi:protein-disulfide isomerase
LPLPGATTTWLLFRTMPSGKKSKQMRRAASAPPPVQSKGGVRRRQADPKVLAIVGGVVVLAAIGIVLALTLGGGSKNKAAGLPTVGTLTNSLPGAADVNTMFKGIPQAGLTLGYASAPVTMVEYIDLQCPFCQQFETQVFPTIVTTYIRTKKLKVVARILDFIGPDSNRGRNAMIAIGAQNRAFDFAELLYYNQGTENTGWLSDGMVGQAVSSIPGVRVPDALGLAATGAVKSQAKGFDNAAVTDKVTGTPTLFVGKSGTKGRQVPLTGPTDEKSLVTALDAALNS